MASLKPRDASGKLAFNLLTPEQFFHEIIQSRKCQGASIESFPFNKSRCSILSKNDKIASGSKGVLYWMLRECRVDDNWALLFAQRLAIKNKLPLFVCFTLFEAHRLYPTRRQQAFLLDGLKQVERRLNELNIKFYLLKESPGALAKLVATNNVGCVICDFNPLKEARQWLDSFKDNLPGTTPLVQVDAHNIVPVWVASDKQELMAKYLRPKINKHLAEYLTGFPEVLKHSYEADLKLPVTPFQIDVATFKVEPVNGTEAGPKASLNQLHSFLNNNLQHYGITSSDPSKDNTSHLSFWLNFGHISAQRVALEVKSFEQTFPAQVDKYLEELIVRRELTDNYCFYNENYDNLLGAASWARNTLIEHKKDKRPYTYTRKQLEQAQTHDPMWNAAQRQLLKEGTMHGYMRMYWCKKILEWTQSPEQALEFALFLNDTFALDGSDPNGFVGVMWSICGVHDQGWGERPIFGKIRFMVDYSLRRKYNMKVYCEKYGVELVEDAKTKKGTKRKAT